MEQPPASSETLQSVGESAGPPVEEAPGSGRTPPTKVPEENPDIASPSRFINRELSWLAFNERVLEEAYNKRHPLLERVRFLSISSSNLDEFYMVRVAGLKGQDRAGVKTPSPEGWTPAEQLRAINERAAHLMHRQQHCWRTLRDELREAEITVLSRADLTADEHKWVERYFEEQLFPILTPIAIDPAHPFPFIPNKGFCLIFELKRLSDGEPIRELLMVPSTLPRFIRLPDTPACRTSASRWWWRSTARTSRRC